MIKVRNCVFGLVRRLAELENDAGSEISAFCCDVMDATLLTPPLFC